MKHLVLAAATLISVHTANASILTSRGLANGHIGTPVEALYEAAKVDALGQLSEGYIAQISEWRTSIVSVGTRLFVSAEAEFEVPDEK
jgi:hypothetical protein